MRSHRPPTVSADAPATYQDRRTSAVSLVATLAFCMPSSAGAWDWTKHDWGEVDRAMVEACLSQMPVGVAHPPCVGRAAEVCETTPPRHQTTLDIVDCRMTEAVVRDEIVEAGYDEQHSLLVTAGRNVAGNGRLSEAEALNAAHEAWKIYREAQCDLVYALDQVGSIKNVRAPICNLNMTADRAIQMRDLFWPPQ